MRIIAHSLIKNEEKFIWYSVMSVIEYVDRIIIWDTGSIDNTLKIISEIQKSKEVQGKITLKKFSFSNFDEGKIRQQMLDEDKSDWIFVLDGDEVWWDDSIKRVVNFIRNEGDNFESLVVPTINPIGDIFHYQEEKAGRYHFSGRIGHYNLRALNRRIHGLASTGGHGTWAWIDKDKKTIQERDSKMIRFINAPYLNLTYLPRSANREDDKQVYKRKRKLKHELGNSFSLDYYYPEVFFKPRPRIVASPWQKMDIGYKFRAFFETPLRKVNRRIMPVKVGY